MYIQRYSLLHLLALLCISNLTISLTNWESIHQTINLFAIAIDFKDFGLLSKVRNLQSFTCKARDQAMAMCLLAQCHPGSHVVNLDHNRSSQPTPLPTSAPVLSPTLPVFHRLRAVSQQRLPTTPISICWAPRSSIFIRTEKPPTLPPTSYPLPSVPPTMSAQWRIFTGTTTTQLRKLRRGGESPTGGFTSRDRVWLAI